IRGPLDLLSVMFMSRFSKRPMHFFGSLGTICFLVGFVILIYLSYMKLVELQYNMTQRPLFYLGIVCLLLGVQLFLAGFLAEMISRSSSSRNEYLVDEIIK
ncbi:MAG: glycosyltransferase, partial [Bacteroidales bacterium]|nr:glycosyltransferase [Bacteroidales bacterium]